MAFREPPAARARSDARAELRRANWRGIDTGNVMSVELIAAVLAWVGIGWLVDRWLGTPPWFLVIGGLVGNFAGLYLVYLRAERMNAQDERLRDEAAGRRPAATPGGSP